MAKSFDTLQLIQLQLYLVTIITMDYYMHALSGCDTASFYNGIGKKTSWDIWRSLPNLKTLFCHLYQTPENITEADIEELERFVVLLYSRTSQIIAVNDARQVCFSHGNHRL